MKFNISHEVQQNICFVYFGGDLELTGIRKGEDYLRPLIYSPELDTFIIDLTEVDLISSSGVAFVTSVYKSIESREKKVGICNIGPRHLKLFKLTKLDRFLKLFSSQQAALDALKG